MATEYLRDKCGRLIGRLEDQGNVIYLRDASGHLLGRYEKSTNTTRDASGRLVGTGNLLTTLLR